MRHPTRFYSHIRAASCALLISTAHATEENNGFQFRSRLLPDHDICGYQVDNNLQTPWLARLYDEYGRHTLAWRGERATFDLEGNRTVTKIDGADGTAWFRLEDWHEYHLIC